MSYSATRQLICMSLLLALMGVTACGRHTDMKVPSPSPVGTEVPAASTTAPDDSHESVPTATALMPPPEMPAETTVVPEETEAAPETPAQPKTSFGDDKVFDIIDGETIWISITEQQLIEYADFLRKELNLNDAGIAGILGNIQGESAFNPNKIGDMGDAYGICQWHGPRLDQMVKYCEEHDLNPIKIESQLAFLAYDLKENYIYPYDLIRLCPDSAQGAVEATYNFCAYYEVPSDPAAESVDREKIVKLLIYPRLNEISKRGE